MILIVSPDAALQIVCIALMVVLVVAIACWCRPEDKDK